MHDHIAVLRLKIEGGALKLRVRNRQFCRCSIRIDKHDSAADRVVRLNNVHGQINPARSRALSYLPGPNETL